MSAVKKNKAVIQQTLKEAENDPSAQEAMKKEKQPINPGDLSAIHDTYAVGTSGGDQRASVTEIKNEDGTITGNAPAKKEIRPQK